MRTKLTCALAATIALGGCIVSGTEPEPEYAQPVVVQQQPQPAAQPVVVQQQPQPVVIQQQPVATSQGVVQQPVATSQAVVQHTTSNFGTVALRPGFVPDPHVAAGTSGGAENARSRGSNCRGWISATPDHLLQANGNFRLMRILAASAQDTTLVVRRPDGSYLCNDDAEGRNPIVQGPFQPGTYAVWVGSYSHGVNAPYRIGFSELTSTTAAQVGGGATTAPNSGSVAVQDAPNFGTVTLAPGFVPDPHVVRGVSGGAVNARTLHSSCRGWISRRPDHLFTASGAFTPLRIMARSSSDTTLVILGPNGQWICDDDGGEGQNPLINRQFAAGTYRIWIGSYNEGDTSRYALGFSELNVGTSALAAP